MPCLRGRQPSKVVHKYNTLYFLDFIVYSCKPDYIIKIRHLQQFFAKFDNRRAEKSFQRTGCGERIWPFILSRYCHDPQKRKLTKELEKQKELLHNEWDMKQPATAEKRTTGREEAV